MGGEVLRFLRVRDWFYYLVLPVLSWEPDTSPPTRLLLGVGVAACSLGFAYGWNNLRDVRLDRSREKNPLVGGIGRSNRHVLLLWILPLLALGGGAWLGPIPVVAAGTQLAGSALYSGGPRIKRLPVLGTLTNLWIFCPLAFLCQGSLPWASGLWAFTCLFGIVLVQNQLLHESMDRDEDLGDGVRTTAALLGVRGTAVLSGVLGLLAGMVTIRVGVSVGMPLLFVGAALPVTVFSLFIVLRPGGDAPARRRRRQRVVGMATCGIAWALYTFLPRLAG